MSVSNTVSCPKCQHNFALESALTVEIEQKIKKELNDKMTSWKTEKEAEFKAKEKEKEAELVEKLALQKKNIELQKKEAEVSLAKERAAMREQIQNSLQAQNEAVINSLKKENEEQNLLVKRLKQQEIDFLDKEKSLKRQSEELELNLKKRAFEMEKEITEKAHKDAEEKNELKLKEYEKKLDDQKKLVEEMRRKQEQGSMQLQGEVQELAIEEWIKSKFPFDKLEEIKKGVRGADCVQTVINNLGAECGKIYYESKRTKDFQPSWIDKFKEDLRENGAEIGVIVTQTMPKELTHFAQKEGVWICTFEDFKALSFVLRDSLLRVQQVAISQVGRVEKTALLYEYMTSNSFRMNIETIVDGLNSLKSDLEKEKNAMQRIWKTREKQMEKVLLGTIDLYGSVKGIAGSSIGEIQSLDWDADLLLNENVEI
ncbi:MAG: DUF2130 domain-containing protein [Pseudarcicella sp.]|nr:DUF2130 domain-containing protein [Pseudarcicella sp.]MBP6410637.1 DUF2130 domain-containing protein [Pseudarcicella sp.]